MLDVALAESDPVETTEPQWLAGQEPIPGYRLLEPLGKGGFGEVWKCHVPGGMLKAIKIVRGNSLSLDGDADLARQELQALEFIKNIRHPFVLSVERVELVADTLLVVMELADRSLDDHFKAHRERGKPGIPRTELVEYLAEAAEALDLINFQHGLQHLDIKPQNLFLVSHHVKVADFGLVTRLMRPKREEGAAATACPGVTPRYASPEALQRRVSRQSDQYSLAIVYQELLTGELPFKGRNAHQLYLQHLQAPPDLNPLPAHDRAVVARALAKDPEQRFGSCADFVRALLLAPKETEGAERARGFSGTIRRLNLNAAKLDATRVDSARNQPPADEPPEQALTYSLDGHTYRGPLGRTGLGELWSLQAPTGEEKIAYHLSGFAVEDAHEQAKALTYLQSLKHPALLRFDIADLSPYRIILVSDPPSPSLLDCRKTAALAPTELVGYLTEVAEALEALATSSNLSHLGLNPSNIVLGLDGVQIRDFGLVPLLWQPGKSPLTQANPRYAAPELALNKPSAASDQYSLAMIYVDMRQERGASKPRKHATPSKKTTMQMVDLSVLPAAERDVVARALDHDPKKRFRSSLEFVQALAEALQPQGGSTTTRSVFLATQAGFLNDLLQWLDKQEVSRTPPGGTTPEIRRLADGGLEHVCAVPIVPGTEPLHLEVFRQECGATLMGAQRNQFELFLPLATTFWQRLQGQNVGIDIRVGIEVSPRKTGLSLLSATIRPVGCDANVARHVREEMGPALIDSLRKSFKVPPERRGGARTLFSQPVAVRHRAPGRAPVEHMCRGKDISALGIAFSSPVPMDQREARITFQLQGEPVPVLLRVKIVRCEPQPNGSYEIGAYFLDDARKP